MAVVCTSAACLVQYMQSAKSDLTTCTTQALPPHLAQCSGVIVRALVRRGLNIGSIVSTGWDAGGRVHTPADPGTVGAVGCLHWKTGVGALDGGVGAILKALGHVDSTTTVLQPVIGGVIGSLSRPVRLLNQSMKGKAVISSSGC